MSLHSILIKSKDKLYGISKTQNTDKDSTAPH